MQINESAFILFKNGKKQNKTASVHLKKRPTWKVSKLKMLDSMGDRKLKITYKL